METIFLMVLSKILCQIEETEINKQISIETSSKFLKEKIKLVNKNKKLSLRIANVINLNLGDPSVILRSDNQDNKHDFDALFRFLCHYPGLKFEFICSIN